MTLVFDSYAAGEEIPVIDYLKNRKLAKYFNRETMAAIVAVGKLQKQTELALDTPFYYVTGMLEYQDYGLEEIVTASRDSYGVFSHQLFVDRGIAAVSPLNQFKVLQNMPVSFVSINFGLQGDNAVLYSSADSLISQARCAPGNGVVLVGAGKVYCDGSVECGFALVERDELPQYECSFSDAEAVELFRQWSQKGHS
jgi:hypothetical protein